MTPQEIEQMKVDRESGTPGPWADFEGEVTGIKASDGRVAVCSQITLMHRRSFSEVAANARRIARVPDMEAEILRLRDALTGLVSDFDNLIADTGGVYGLHLNGAPAPWSELTQGGEFEEWTAGLEPARRALNGDAP